MGYENRNVGVAGAVNLKYMPSPVKEYATTFERLDGGLNISELDNRLSLNESPDMQNLMWIDGALGCRDGQKYIIDTEDTGTGYTCSSELFWGKEFIHVGTTIKYFDPTDDDPTLTTLASNVPEVRGTFFRYGDFLLYKTVGYYTKIKYSATAPHFSCEAVTPYVPIIQINSDPDTGAGDTYQDENRLSAQKIVKFSAKATLKTLQAYGDGSNKVFSLGCTSADTLARVAYVMVGSNQISETQYTVNLEAGTVTIATAPQSSQFVGIAYYENTLKYQLPIKALDSIDEVKVDGVVKTPTTDYLADTATGLIAFVGKAPPTTNPLTANTVEVKFTKANADAKKAIDDCKYAIVYGGNQSLCIVMAGCEAQPNAYFWNGNDSLAMNPGYFPFISYNFGGDTEDGIVGFGKQQNLLVVFKHHGIGKVSYSTTTINDLTKITMDYENINSRIGCDLPNSIQLIENNLVFANTKQGVFYVKDSSSAYENNIVCISEKINGSEYEQGQLVAAKNGLIRAVRGSDPSEVCSFDDNMRYWICSRYKTGVDADGNDQYAYEAFVWDYSISEQTNPSWFKFTNIQAVAFFVDDENDAYHLDRQGRITKFTRTFNDYGESIPKYYQFAVQNFGSYQAYKNITGLLLVVRSDTDSVMNIKYITDWEERYDLTPIVAYNWRLVPRNLLYRFLGISRYATVAKRRPGCRNVRHFTLRLENDTAGNDMSIISGQFFYKFKGGQR